MPRISRQSLAQSLGWLALSSLVVCLVVLEIRWLDELEEAQHDQMQHFVVSGAARIADEIDAARADDAETVPDARIEAVIKSVLGDEALEVYDVTIESVANEAPLYRSCSEVDFGVEPVAVVDVLGPMPRWVSFIDEGGETTNLDVEPLELPLAELTSPWQLVVRHRAGSLADVVARGRRNKLLVSGAVLGLLVVGVALASLAQQRARRLAEKELLFVAGVSHDLRTPLAVLRSAASNLATGVVAEPEKVGEYGALIEREVMRVSARVERVLRFSRRAELDESPETFDVEGWIAEAVQGCEHWHDRRRFAVEVDVDPNLPPLTGDSAALVCALENLIDNAIKYGPDDQTVRITAFQRERAKLVVQVADEGPGIPPDERSLVFEPFFRGAAARAGVVTGSGLGLGVVRQVASDHGGSVVLAEAERGSVFEVQVPCSHGSEA